MAPIRSLAASCDMMRMRITNGRFQRGNRGRDAERSDGSAEGKPSSGEKAFLFVAWSVASLLSSSYLLRSLSLNRPFLLLLLLLRSNRLEVKGTQRTAFAVAGSSQFYGLCLGRSAAPIILRSSDPIGLPLCLVFVAL